MQQNKCKYKNKCSLQVTLDLTKVILCWLLFWVDCKVLVLIFKVIFTSVLRWTSTKLCGLRCAVQRVREVIILFQVFLLEFCFLLYKKLSINLNGLFLIYGPIQIYHISNLTKFEAETDSHSLTLDLCFTIVFIQKNGLTLYWNWCQK